MLDSAESLEDLRVPPANNLKKLAGDKRSFYSIRVNLQWRIVFLWTEAGPEEVEFIDYH
jgi:proteic killer suppression protein